MTNKEPFKIISTNKKASFQFTLLEKYEAGLELLGSEVKAIREGSINIKESYVRFKNNELFAVGMHVGEYSHLGYTSHNPLRDKKLLLHKNEILKIIKDVNVKGKTVIPTKIYLKNGKIKIEIAIAKGKKIWDKRNAKKDKEIIRELARSRKGT